MQISIGTNMMESGEDWRMARSHLETIAASGIKCVEIHPGTVYERADGPVPFRRAQTFVDFADPIQLRQIRTWLDELGLRPVGLHASPMGMVDLASVDAEVRSYAAGELGFMPEACRLLDAPVMVVHPGEHKAGTGPVEQGPELAESLAAILPQAEQLGIRIALENLQPGSSSSQIELLVDAVDRLGHPLIGICLDTGHANMSGYGPAEAVRAIGHRLFALHVHDNDGQRDLHAPPFTGAIDWTGFVDALKDVGYSGTLNLEVIDRQGGKPASLSFIRDTVAAARRLLAEQCVD